eukprot:2297206-Prymnesium_polylepis.1
MRAAAVTARSCRLRWTMRSWLAHVARCGRWVTLAAPESLRYALLFADCSVCWLCFAPQRAAHQGGEALSVGLRLLGGEPQAQLDGFKS